MLNEKICSLREKLNDSIIEGKEYSIIYQLSIELDELIAQYYREEKTSVEPNAKKEKNS
ncbi:MAG: aspartyl-phosphate phosphatase Spo0E family protein [Clostridia bacterium]